MSMTEAQGAPLAIDVVSDVMCPWCYIGKRRLSKALDLVPDIATEIRWRPFQLDASIPPEGIDRQDYLDRKFGRDQAREVYTRIREAGEAEGIPFAFDLIQTSPNTINAHRLIRWAGGAGHQDAVVERLFELYFVEGENIGETDVLLSAARDGGMDADLVEDYLEGDFDRELVEREIALAHELGIEGVPAFILDGKYAVLGAQDPNLLAQAMTRVQQEAQTAEADQDDA